jgi:hypothetical protein
MFSRMRTENRLRLISVIYIYIYIYMYIYWKESYSIFKKQHTENLFGNHIYLEFEELERGPPPGCSLPSNCRDTWPKLPATRPSMAGSASHHTYHSRDNTIKLPIIAAATHSLKISKPENQTSPLHFHTHT